MVFFVTHSRMPVKLEDSWMMTMNDFYIYKKLLACVQDKDCAIFLLLPCFFCNPVHPHQL